jgi:cysteine synthase A
MSKWFEDNALTIGNTPLVRLNRVTDGAKATVLAKIEGRNPAYSVKCRIGAAMVWDAEKRGVLKPGKEIVEPTSGNTGIALAFVAAARGYPLTLTMPETMSIERRKFLIAYGAKLVLTEGPKGMTGAVAQGRGDRGLGSGAVTCCSSSSRTPRTRRSTRPPPAPRSGGTTDGNVDIFVSGVGTGGTITGVSRYFKKTQNRAIRSVAVEPSNSPVITPTTFGSAPQARAPQDPGHRRRLHPRQLGSVSLVDQVEQVSNEEAVAFARRLAKEEGILAGISCGAAAAVAVRFAPSCRRTPARPSSPCCPTAVNDTSPACCSRVSSTPKGSAL